MICKNCGREISSQNSYCPHCNVEITAEEVEKYRREKAQLQKENEDEGVNKGAIAALIALGVFVLLAIVSAFLLTGNSGKSIRYNYYEKHNQYDKAEELIDISKTVDNDRKYYEFIDTATKLFDETEYDKYVTACDAVMKAYKELNMSELSSVRQNKAKSVKTAIDKLMGYNFADVRNKMRIAYDLHEEINKYKLKYGFNVKDEEAKLFKWQEDYKDVNKIYADIKGADIKEYSSVLRVITKTMRELDDLKPDDKGMAFFEEFDIAYQNSPELAKIDSEVATLKNMVVYNCSKSISMALYGNTDRVVSQKPVNYEENDAQKTYDLFNKVIDFNSYIKTSRSTDSDFEHYYRYVDGEDPVQSIENYVKDMSKQGFTVSERTNAEARGVYVLQGETERVRISYNTVDKTVSVRIENTNVPQ